MLTFKSMSWDNCFSYGSNNKLIFDKEPLTQLTGANGAGKTSIALMLQEVLYGKNTKNIKKQDIANNKTDVKGYTIILNFIKDKDEYSIELERKAGIKLKLYKNSIDISSHTSLNTYKTISDIIGIDDFKVFCQLIYQHSTDSLDFLTATDMNRKKFLISLLQLDKYIELHEIFKDKVRITNSVINSLEGGVNTVESWINKHKDMDFIKQDLLESIIVPQELYAEAETIKDNIDNINHINLKIATNNQYRSEMNELDPLYYMGIAPAAPNPGVNELRAQVRELETVYKFHQTKVDKINKVSGVCSECLQEVNMSIQESMSDKEINLREAAKRQLGDLWDKIPKTEKLETEIKKYAKERSTFERLSQLIDSKLGRVTLDIVEEIKKLNEILNKIKELESVVKYNEKKNLEISAHNSKVDVVKKQLEDFKKDLQEKNIDLMEKENLNSILELLKKTFGTNGLVSYKIESSVKELEKKINKYLSELTHFQLYFKLAGEKLNIEILDDLGNISSINNLSSGEQARVNLAALLGIRSTLSALTNVHINFLMIDEVEGSLDQDGKEKFADILLKEKLNTFMVSHSWAHPLVPKINIVKNRGISKIEQ